MRFIKILLANTNREGKIRENRERNFLYARDKEIFFGWRYLRSEQGKHCCRATPLSDPDTATQPGYPYEQNSSPRNMIHPGFCG